jgi:diguanylate cyclase (GGDEF)-like protein
MTASSAELGEALQGTVASELVSHSIDGMSKKVLRTYAPFRLADGSGGVVLVDKDYAPIASAARKGAIAVAAVLEFVLLALWLCLIPIMRSATRRIHRQLETIAHLALHDDLTGLPNRAQLCARLDELLQSSGEVRLAVFFIDLDRFKEVNDTLGHDRGNELLVEIAKRLEGTLAANEFVARLGGDEFAVISERTVEAPTALELAERLRTVIAELFEISGISIEPQASIGIALAPAHGTSRDELLRRADIAMYAAKRGGVPQVFVPELDDHSPVRLAMTGELRRALDGNELVLHYQPQFDLRVEQVRSAEALVRWRHPSGDLLEPGAFLSAIDHAGLMRSLTRYVLHQSLAQLRSWHDLGLDLRLAINISARDLADARFPEELAQALTDHRIEPSALELEITENVLLSENVRASGRLERIVDLGVRIAIDDFGVGYSSLGQLKNVPAQVLKIDQSFVLGMPKDRRDAAIVRSTIELAHQLGLEVVAEGVETTELVARLREAGCDVVQGYLVGRPLPVGENGDAGALAPDAGILAVAETANVVPLRRASR